jgi:hypothetical protein
VLAPSATTVIKSLKLEVRVYPITKLTIDHDGTGALNNLVTITLKNIAYRADLLTGLIVNGNLVLEASSPTLTIIGSGGIDAAANT